MEVEAPRANPFPGNLHGVIPALSATLFISMGYIDPGKWVACIDSGARFGGELVVFLFLFNLMAILCQYISAHVGSVTGKNLAQICNDEYDKFNCIALGIQAELSIIVSDLSMILGIAHALHMMLGVELFSSVLLTAMTAILFPLFSTLLEGSRENTILTRIAGVTLLCYVLGMLFAQPEFSASPISLPSKLMGENVYAVMTLLGASIMPHNFFLHSSIAQRFQSSPGAARVSRYAYDSFLGIVAVFSGIFLVNYMLMNSAASMFYSSGITLPTFHDAMSMMEESFWSPIGPLIFFLLLSSSHISGLSWEAGGESGHTVLYDFFGIDLPGWLHCATVRIFSVVPVLYCLGYSGAEGMYQMLLSTQVMVALLLPPSVIALYRIACTSALMGTNKVPAAMEFCMLMSFLAMIGLQLVFFCELLFCESAWLGYLRWNMGTARLFGPYTILIVSCCASLCLSCRLFVTRLRSVDQSSDAQPLNWDKPQDVRSSLAETRENDRPDLQYFGEMFPQRSVLVKSSEKVLEARSDALSPIHDFNLPDTIMETDQGPYSPPVEEISAAKESSVSPVVSLEQPAQQMAGPVLVSDVIQDCSNDLSLGTGILKSAEPKLAEKACRVEGEPASIKDSEERESWMPEEAPKAMLQAVPPVAPEGPRSLSGKFDEGGSGTGSLSRLSGLGRAARRQMAALLDEFWGQFYDFHGNFTQEAKAKKLVLLMGCDAISRYSLPETDLAVKDYRPQYQSMGGGASDPSMYSGLHAPSQQRLPNSIGSLHGGQKPSLWADKMHGMDAYPQSSSSSSNALDNSERRYSSLRLPPRSEGVNQSATMQGYQLSSYVSRAMQDQSADYYMDGQRKYASMKMPSSSLGMNQPRDSHTYGMSPMMTNGYSTMQTSPFPNPPTPRNTMMQPPDRSSYELFSPVSSEDAANQNNAKKYHSLPDISGISVPPREVYLSEKYAQLSSPKTPAGYATTPFGRATPERSPYSSLASRMGPPGFDDLSPRKARRDVFPSRSYSGLDAASLWHKQQAYDQYGVANKTSLGPEATGQRSMAAVDSASSIVDTEVKLLRSMRNCIIKLLKLEGSEWLFRQADGLDEDLIEHVAARERFVFEAESRDMKLSSNADESLYSGGPMRPGSAAQGDARTTVSSVPHCGEGCVWKADLIVSFGVWCIHRILELSLMESRPELWGKYTYVLNRLQGVVESAFVKPRNPLLPCFCLQVPAAYQQRLSPISNGAFPPTARPPRGKFTSSAMIVEIIKDVEIAISSRKGRSGTAAGDVAFPKGKENLASVLKRYKRRLASKPVGASDPGNRPVSRNLSVSSPSPYPYRQ